MEENRPRPIRRIASALLWLVFVPLAGHGLLSVTSPWTIAGELASHFRWHLGLGSAAALLLTLPAAAPIRGFILVLLAFYGAAPEARLSLGEIGDPTGPTLKIVSANVLRPNQHKEEVLAAIDAEDPDLIGLLEVSPEWRDAAFARFGERFPFVIEGKDTDTWDGDSWGLMLFAREPLGPASSRTLTNGDRRLRPILRATVMLRGTAITIDLAHAQRPGRTWRLEDRRIHFDALRRPTRTLHHVVLGDLNTTSTSPLFTELLEDTGLRDSREGFGRQPSWRLVSHLPGPFPIRIPPRLRAEIAIDHALVSPEIRVFDRRVLPLVGSDHDAVVVTIGL